MIHHSLGRVHRTIRNGYHEHYPWCCVARFGWDSLIGVKSELVRGISRKRVGDGARWVPCGWWHHADPYETAIGYRHLIQDKRETVRSCARSTMPMTSNGARHPAASGR